MTTDTLTALAAADTRLAVRYRHHGSDTYTYKRAADADEQTDVLHDLLMDSGIVGEPVEIHVVPGPPAIRDAVAREFVEKQIDDLVDGERTIDEVAENIRPLCPDLLGDDEADAIKRAHGQVSAGCVRVHRIEQLADLVAVARDIKNGLADPADRDLDADERQQGFLLDVLAGVEHHSANGHPCTKTHSIPAETKVQAA